MHKHGPKIMPVFTPADGEIILVTTSKFGLLNIRQHSATRKHLLPYPQGDSSGVRKPKKDKHQH